MTGANGHRIVHSGTEGAKEGTVYQNIKKNKNKNCISLDKCFIHKHLSSITSQSNPEQVKWVTSDLKQGRQWVIRVTHHSDPSTLLYEDKM